MERDSPEPQPFDPALTEAPRLADATAAGGFVLLVAASGAGDRDWAERSATSLAAGWARQGRRILLADLSLMRPGLHRVLGVENREGVSDTFLFGSSIQRVARPVREQGFLFVSAGTATARPEAVTGSSRWGAVVEGCARVQATLVVFLPSDLPGGETLLGRASDVVLLTDRSASGSAALQAGLGDRLRAVLVPPAADEPLPAFANAPGASISTPEPTPAFAATTLPLLSAEEPAPPVADAAPEPSEPAFASEQVEPSFAMEGPEPDFAVEEPVQSFAEAEPAVSSGFEAAAAPAAPVAPEPSFASAAADPSFAISQPPPDVAAAGAPSMAEEPAAEVIDVVGVGGAFGEIELAALPDSASQPSAEPGADFLGGMDLDLGALPQGGAPVEEVPSFSGELAFLEPEPVASTSEPVPMATSSWAPPASEGMPAPAGSDLRATEIPMREADGAPGRERPKPGARPGTRAPSRPEPSAPAKSRAGTLALVAVVALVGLLGAAWYRVVEIPVLSGWLAGFAPPVSATPAPEGGGGGTQAAAPNAAESRANGISLTLDSFTDAAIARLQASSLNEQRPDLLFVVAPVQQNGRVYHRLLAGPAADSAGAEALRATLATVLTRENPTRWVMRSTTLAFNMGDRDDLASAAERVAQLSRVDIPAYVLELPGRNAAGARVARYRVYAGAYADEAEGTYLRNLLVSKGFPDARLVPRIGRHPQ